MQEVEAYLNSLYTAAHKMPGESLAVVRSALELLGDPQNTIPAIHIAGTSGKGSTAYYSSAFLQAAGYTVGLVVSPHVNTVRERSQVNGSPLPEDEYVKYFNEFKQLPAVASLSFSYIEFLTVFSYWLFARVGVEYMVIEVGLGGRLDPTNVITQKGTVRVITDIGLDHTEILGDTLVKIAKEKAGIIHPNDVVVMNNQQSEIIDTIRAASDANEAELNLHLLESIGKPSLPLFQQRNFSLARRAVDLRLGLDAHPGIVESVIDAAAKVHIPGRFEIFTIDGVDVILDVAHNVQKIGALTESLEEKFPDTKFVYLVAFGDSRQAQLGEVLGMLWKKSACMYATRFTSDYKSATNPNEVVRIMKQYPSVPSSGIDDPYEAFNAALSYARGAKAPLVVTGSFFLIEGIRSLFMDPTELLK